MPGLVPGIHVFKTALPRDVDGRNESGHDAIRCVCIQMSLLRENLDHTDERSARLAGIGLMLLSVFMFSFGDALGKFIVATYSVGQLLWLRGLRGADRAVAVDLAAPQRILPAGAAVAAIAAGRCSRRSKSRRSSSPPSICRSPTSSPIIWRCPIFVTALSAIVLREQVGWRRWSAVLIGFCGVLIALRPSAQTVSWPAMIALGRQHVVRGADADHAFAARDAGYRAGLDAIRRHVRCSARCWRRSAGSRRRREASALFAAAGCISVCALLCVNRSLKLAPACVVVPYQYSMIIWAVMFGYAVFGDVPSIATIVGAAIIIGAGFYIFLRERDLGREETVVSPPA